MASSNDRQQPRQTLLAECEIEGNSGLTTIRLADLSADGCYVDTRWTATVGAEVAVRLTLRGRSFRLTGHVVHAHPGIGFGMRFENTPEETRQFLLAFLHPASLA